METKKFIEDVKKGSINVVDHTVKVIDELKKINKEYHYLTNISEEVALECAKNVNKAGKLAGVAVSLKDAICLKGVPSSAGSKILKDYKPIFDATIVQKLKAEGAIIVGKTSQDEFGFGGFNVNVGIGFEIPLNPVDKERSCGGSSGGAAGIAQKTTMPHIAIGESTGGSIVAPASFCGIVGLCPTYGRVSRYGLIDYANSMDKIGPMAKTVYETALALEVISGFDSNESTTLKAKVENYTSFVGKDIQGLRVGIIKESLQNIDKDVEEAVRAGIEILKEAGAKIEEVSLPLSFTYGIPTYYILAPSEASTNLAKLCGLRYGAEDKIEGNFDEYFTKIRSENFGNEAKRRIMLGNFARMAGYRDAYYIKAAKVRTLIIEEYKKLFAKFDILVSPTCPILAPKINDIKKLSALENYMLDIMTLPPNLAGLPHMSVPVGMKKGLPVGIMLTANHLCESKLIMAGSAIEKSGAHKK